MKGTYYSGKFLKHRVSCHLCARLYAGCGEWERDGGGRSGRREERKREKEARNAGGKRREEEEEEREKREWEKERESVSRGNQITRRGAQAGGLSFTVIN